jgi:uncharacterized membrane protein
MFGFFTFLHIIGFIIWLGLLTSMAIFLPMLKNQINTEGGQKIVTKVIRSFNAITHLSAIAVLISGIYRVVQLNFAVKPFWLNYMEMAGGMIVLLGIILLTILGWRVTRPLNSRKASPDLAVVEKRLSAYITAVVLLMLLILSVVLVVSFRL